MATTVKARSWWMILPLVSAAGFAASNSDLRVLEAVRNKDSPAVRSLIKQHADVNTAGGDGATALAWAAHWNDLEMADLLIGAGANVNKANIYGVTPLWEACNLGSGSMVERLLKAGANAKAAKSTGETALMRCAYSGDVNAVKALLTRGADVNAKETRRGQTALMWAVAERHADVAQALIDHGADVHARTKHEVFPGSSGTHYNTGYEGDFRERAKGGLTPLLFAAEHGDVECIRALLAAGADVNETTPEGGTALVLASANAHEAAGKFLLEKGANPNVADSDGMTPLHWTMLRALMIVRGIIPYSYERYLYRPNLPELAKALLAHGANPNARIARGPELPFFIGGGLNPIGATPFLLAATTYDADILVALKAAGADPNVATEEERITPLMMAVALGQKQPQDRIDTGLEARAMEAAKLVVESGGDLNATNSQGQTALHLAASRGSNAVVQFLVSKGANVDAKDKDQKTALSMASAGGHKTTAELLLKLGATPVADSGATRSGGVGIRPAP